MDWSETVRKAAALAEATGHITFDQLNDLIPPETESEDNVDFKRHGIRIADD